MYFISFRNCIGQKFGMLEIKVVMAKVLRRYNIRTKYPRDRMVLLPQIVMKNEEGLPISLELRDP